MRFAFLSIVFAPMMAWAALVDPRLQTFAHGVSGTSQVLVLMETHFTHPFPQASNAKIVSAFLSSEAQIAFAKIQQNLVGAVQSRDIRLMNLYFVNLSFMADVTPAGLKVLAQTPGVEKIYLNAAMTAHEPLAPGPQAYHAVGDLPYDVVAISLDQMIKAYPTVNGTGVLVGHIDTGVDGRHPALAGKVALFYDSSAGKVMEPTDSDTHGTHTAGTVVGAPRGDIPMGMAPGAKLLSVGGLRNYDSMVKGMEYMLKPAGNLQPRLVTNSWNCEGAPDVEAFYRGISAWEAAGIMPVFSAGNSGPGTLSITKPHEHPMAFAVGAYGPGGKIANFSSRGPAMYHSQQTYKPDVAAPGVDIFSSLPGGRFGTMSGTSMAAPHVAGVAALLFQVQPNLTPAKMRELISRSADYVDHQGQTQADYKWNANYGFGRINVLKAVNMLKSFMFRQSAELGTALSPMMRLSLAKEVISDVPAASEKSSFEDFETDRSNWIEGNAL